MPTPDKDALIGQMLSSADIERQRQRNAAIPVDEPGPTVEMPRYKCHKEVWALKIKQVIKHAHPDPLFNDAMFEASPEFQGAHLFFEDAGYGPVPVEANWYRKHNPEAGGYYVLYKDGYRSFSPADAFEEGYTRV